jgi:4-amino-4-deoxy-L-arabinose transferase-like glycosyltransferase
MYLELSAIAARSENSPAYWRRPFQWWLDGVEAGWGIPLLLIGFVGIWQAFLAIAYCNGDLHPDVLEAWSYGRSIEWGYTKHPPLMGWVAHAWTSVFPLTDWSFQLLALTNSAIALWVVDLISRRFVRGDKRVCVLLLLMLLPAYQLHAQRFNANTVLLASWPIATYCFLRSFETRRFGWAIAAGATAALAMLGKYYSAFLIASFLFAALCHPQRRAYFGSLAPWISVTVGLAALAPHLHWLATTGATPIHYALTVHAGKSFALSLHETAQFIFGVALVLALPAATWVSIVKERLARFPGDFRAMNHGLRLLFFVAVGTILLPTITAVGLGTDMSPIWALQGLFLFSILIVCGTSYTIERFYTVNLAVFVIGLAVVAALVVAPIHAVYRNRNPLHEGRNFYEKSAQELTRLWHNHSAAALPTVGGDDVLAFAAAFYSPDHPVYDELLSLDVHDGLPGPETLERGWAALCFKGDTHCVTSLETIAASSPRFISSEFVVESTLLGHPGVAQRFTALIVPPSSDGESLPSSTPATAEEYSAAHRASSRPD